MSSDVSENQINTRKIVNFRFQSFNTSRRENKTARHNGTVTNIVNNLDISLFDQLGFT